VLKDTFKRSMLFSGDIPFIKSSVKMLGVRVSRMWNQCSRVPF